MKQRIIAVGAHKGGVGKTTIAVTLAAWLAMIGRKVVLVDLDAQAAVADWLGLEHRPALYDLVVNDKTARDLIEPVPFARWTSQSVPAGRLYVLPGDRTNETVWKKCGDPLRLRDKLHELLAGSDVEYVLLDTPPAISQDAVSYLLAAGRLVIPTKPSYLAWKGVYNTLLTIQRLAHKTSCDVEVMGVVPNLYNSTRSVHQQNLAALRQKFPALIWPVLNDYAAFEEIPQAHESIFLYRPGLPTAERARMKALRLVEVFGQKIGVLHAQAT